MQLTRFHVLIRDFPVAGEHVLYNTLTDNLVGLDDRALDWITALDGGEPAASLAQDEIDYLAAERFLVAGERADDDALRDFMLGMKQGDGVLRVRVLVTENCNFGCPYCFEAAGGPTGPGMGKTVEEALHGWVRRRMARFDLHTLELTYFGGEPLLKKPLILRTAERFQRELAEDGRAFRCNIITNGALLDRAFVDAMAPLGLEFVKVTLDGPKHFHDQTRVHKSGAGSWDEILANLKAVAGHVRIRIGSNVPAGLEREFGELADELTAQGLAGAIEDLNFKPVLDARGDGACASRFADADPEGLVHLQLKAIRSGMSAEPNFGVGPCGLHMDQYLLVDAGGYLYKCDVLVGDPRMAVGRITDDAWLPRVELLETLDPVKDCGQCPYLPVCAGGCRAATYRKNGTLGVSCEHDYFETVGRETLKRRYLDEFYEGEMPSEKVAATAA